MATSTLPALSRPSTASESASGKQLSRTASFVGMKQQQQGQQRPRSRGELTEVYDLEHAARIKFIESQRRVLKSASSTSRFSHLSRQ